MYKTSSVSKKSLDVIKNLLGNNAYSWYHKDSVGFGFLT